MRAVLVVTAVAISTPAGAATIHGLVYEDTNGDGKPSAGERGVAGAVVAFDVTRFTTTDASGQFDLDVGDAKGIVWARVPDGYTPGPVWSSWTGSGDVDLGLRPLAHPIRGPLTFVVAADTHLPYTQQYIGEIDLATAATEATALDPAPAFFTILGDITQGNRDAEFDLVDRALSGLGVPWIPVPGNHDWYDGGATWFRRYGPDNYSFDIDRVHFVVWNMAMSDDDIRAYLGAELSYVAPGTTIVALTHAPPSQDVIDVLHSLGVAYVLTGHAHSNRPVDHDGLIELNTEPMLMGGLDFTPAGYRVITIEAGHLTSYHRTVVEEPLLAVMSPAHGQCIPRTGGELIVAAELDASASAVTARVDCATPVALRWAGGWSWRMRLPPLDPGAHEIAIEATSASGNYAAASTVFEICDPGAPPAAGPDWPQLGGSAAHTGSRAEELVPPLVTRWTVAVGGHVLAASPAIAGGSVYVATTDLAGGDAGGIVAIDLVTGAVRWRAPAQKPVRGGVAVVGNVVVYTQIDGAVFGLDVATGVARWRYDLSVGLPPGAGAAFAPPAIDGGDVLVGQQRHVAVLAGDAGMPLWTAEPVPQGVDSQSLAAIAIGEGVAVGTFNRALGGVIAWDRATGSELWRVQGKDAVAINATPLVAGDSVYVVNGADVVIAVDIATGAVRWRDALDPAGFDWGNATIGTPALAQGILVVPTLYRDLVAVDATSGAELWRYAGAPGPLRTTHYRGAHEAGFAASPVITGGIVWAVDTAGELVALDLHTGEPLWQTAVGMPVLAGLATSGDWLVAASYDGTVRALVATPRERPAPVITSCTEPRAGGGGCCDSSGTPSPLVILLVAALRRRRA